MILIRNIVKKSGVIPYLNPRSWDIAEILLPHQRSCHFQKRFKLNLCSKIRSLFSLADSLYAVLLDLNDFTLADDDPKSRFLYRGFVNRDVWQWYVDINLTNEDRTGTHLLLKLLLNSALQHSSSFDAKIQNILSRATAKGNQFMYGICYQSEQGKHLTPTAALDICQRPLCSASRSVVPLVMIKESHLTSSVCWFLVKKIFFCSFWRLRKAILRLHINKCLIFFSWKFLMKNVFKSSKSFLDWHGKYTVVNIVSLGSSITYVYSNSCFTKNCVREHWTAIGKVARVGQCIQNPRFLVQTFVSIL